MGECEGARGGEGRFIHGRRQRQLESERAENGAEHLRHAVACITLLPQPARTHRYVMATHPLALTTRTPITTTDSFAYSTFRTQ